MTEEFPIELPPSAKEMADYTVTRKEWEDALRYYDEHRKELIEAAAASRKNAVSHRDPPFEVGCAAMGMGPGAPKGEYIVGFGHNFTPSPQLRRGGQKRCAERNASEGMRRDAKIIVAVVTVSKETVTGDPTKALGTLHPCKECRDMYREYLREGFVREGTIICTVNDSGKKMIVEEITLGDLLEIYKDDLPVSDAPAP